MTQQGPVTEHAQQQTTNKRFAASQFEPCRQHWNGFIALLHPTFHQLCPPHFSKDLLVGLTSKRLHDGSENHRCVH